MKSTFLSEHSGPFVIFGDFLYPTHSRLMDNYVARPTASGHESLIGLLEPVPLKDIEQNDLFSRAGQLKEYEDALLLSTGSAHPISASDYKDRLDTLSFIVGGVFPLLVAKKEDEELTPERIAAEIIGANPPRRIDEAAARKSIGALAIRKARPYFETMPDISIANLAFPDGMFPPSDSSILSKTLNFNPVYVVNGYVCPLRTSPRKGSDRIHIHGRDFYWSRRHEIRWIEEKYIPMIHEQINQGIRKKLQGILEAHEQLDVNRNPYSGLAELDQFEFRNLAVRWLGKKCYLTMKRGKFARQDYEHADKWHPRESFEVGAAIYFSGGNIFFGETPVVKADYADVAFYATPAGIFRLLCSQEKDQWQRFEHTPEGAALYIRAALDIFYNGFSPDNVKSHLGPFGDGKTYGDICPLEKAFTASSLDEVRQKGYEPVNIHLPLN